MAWTYCRQCNHPMDYPDLAEIIIGFAICPNCQDTDTLSVDEDDRINAVRKLLTEIKGLHNHVT